MKVFSYSEARLNLASVLDRAQKEGAVRITPRNGMAFTLKPEVSGRSPLDVAPVTAKVGLAQIISAVRESRERG